MQSWAIGHWLPACAGRGSLIADRDIKIEQPIKKSRPSARENRAENTRLDYQDRGIVELRIRQRQQDRHPCSAGAASEGWRSVSTPLRSEFVVATSRRTIKKASLKRGLQRRSGGRVQLPKNNHSRSITGIGTPISQSKSPFPITVSLNVIYIRRT